MSFGHIKKKECRTEDIKNEGGNCYYNVIHKVMCEEQHMHNKRCGTSNIVRIITLLLRALLLDEL